MSRLICVRTLRKAAVAGSAHPLSALSAIGIALWMGGAQGAEPPEVEFKMKIDKVLIEPATVQQGKTAVIRCQWSAQFKSKAEKGYYEVKANAPGEGAIGIRIQKTGSNVNLKQFHHIVKPGYYTPDSLPKGEFNSNWIPDVAGSALISCSVRNHWEPWQTAKVEKFLPVYVALAPYKKDSSPQAAANIAPSPPKLEILGATATLTGNCSAGPGPFLTAKLNIGNSGKTLPPNRGIVRIRGHFGTYPESLSFSNGDAGLPEIKAGMTVAEFPVGVQFPDKSKLAILSGTTRIFSVNLLPKTSGAFPTVAFNFPVSFPPGVCAAKTASPAAPVMPLPMAPATPAQGGAGRSSGATTTAPRLPAVQKPQTNPGSPPAPQRPVAPRQ